MTSNRTIKTSIKRSLILVAAVAGMASASAAYGDDATRVASTAQTVTVPTTAAAQSAQKFDLRKYGDRFKLAIEAIRKNSQKPDWTWDEGESGRVAKMK